MYSRAAVPAPARSAATFARYIVTPLIMLWVVYLVIRGIVDHSALLGHHPKNSSGLAFWQVVGVVLGFADGTLWPTKRARFPYMEEMLQ